MTEERNDRTTDDLPVNDLTEEVLGSKPLDNDGTIKGVTDDGLPVNDLTDSVLAAFPGRDVIIQALNGGQVNLTPREEKFLRMTHGIPCDNDAPLDFPGSGRGHEGGPRTSLAGLTPVDVAEARAVRDSVLNVMMDGVVRGTQELRELDAKAQDLLRRIRP